VTAPEPRALSPARKLVFGLVTAGLVLAGLNAVVELGERAGHIDTQSATGTTVVLEEAIFAADGASLVTTPYAEQTMVRSRIATDKGSRTRVFVTGGSFAQGAPYTYPNQPDEGFGGISSWLRQAFAGQDVEFVNVASGGQASPRVEAIVEELVTLDADAVVVATCNNEGSVQPGQMLQVLHEFGVYRLLSSALQPNGSGGAPMWASPSSDEAVEHNTAYERNLRLMATKSAAAGVPLFLATVPIQLRHGGHEAGPARTWIPRTWSGEDQVDACIAKGRAEFEAEDYRAAAMTLAGCGAHPAARETLEAAYMALWRQGLSATDGELSPGACVADLVASFRQHDYDAVIARAPTCEDGPIDAIFWSGLALAELDRLPEAVAALEQAVELRPQGRCRPSLNAIARAVAADFPHVTLVDLDAEARTLAPRGIPGPEMFAGNCHLRWSGYVRMAQVIGEALSGEGVLAPPSPMSSDAINAVAENHGLSRDPWTDDVLRR